MHLNPSPFLAAPPSYRPLPLLPAPPRPLYNPVLVVGGAGPLRPQQGRHVDPPPGEEVDHLELKEGTRGAVRPIQ